MSCCVEVEPVSTAIFDIPYLEIVRDMRIFELFLLFVFVSGDIKQRYNSVMECYNAHRKHTRLSAN